MQVGSSSGSAVSSYRSQFAGNQAADGQGMNFSQLADYNSSSNTLFQNLLADESVKDNVIQNEDGTYTFSEADGTLQGTSPEHIAKLLIAQQNGYQSTDAGEISPYTVSELAQFRETTGYNLIQAGGMFTVVDDYGNRPAQSDREMVRTAWQAFDSAKGANELFGDGSELTLTEISDALECMKTNATKSTTIDDLLEMIDRRQPLQVEKT